MCVHERLMISDMISENMLQKNLHEVNRYPVSCFLPTNYVWGYQFLDCCKGHSVSFVLTCFNSNLFWTFSSCILWPLGIYFHWPWICVKDFPCCFCTCIHNLHHSLSVLYLWTSIFSVALRCASEIILIFLGKAMICYNIFKDTTFYSGI